MAMAKPIHSLLLIHNENVVECGFSRLHWINYKVHLITRKSHKNILIHVKSKQKEGKIMKEMMWWGLLFVCCSVVWWATSVTKFEAQPWWSTEMSMQVQCWKSSGCDAKRICWEMDSMSSRVRWVSSFTGRWTSVIRLTPNAFQFDDNIVLS